MPLRRSAPLEIGLEIEAGLEIADLDPERDLEAEIKIGPPAPLEIGLEIEVGLEIEIGLEIGSLPVPVPPPPALSPPAAFAGLPRTALRLAPLYAHPPASHRRSNPKPIPNPTLTRPSLTLTSSHPNQGELHRRMVRLW